MRKTYERYCDAVAAMMRGPRAKIELNKALGLPTTQDTGYRIMEAMHDRGLVRIMEYRLVYSNWMPIFEWQNIPFEKDDCPPPELTPGAQRRRILREAKKAASGALNE